MFLPTGEVYLEYTDGSRDLIMITDLLHPRKELLTDKHILEYIQRKDIKKIDNIVYEEKGIIVKVSMAEYYAEHGQEL